jgi:gamma-glutamyltranspeptidase
MTPNKREYYVLQLLEQDKHLLRHLAEKAGSMNEAMLALAPIVEKLEWPSHEPPKRYPVRIPVPGELKKVLERVHKKSGTPLVEILLKAARHYAEKGAKAKR